jgi:hypothetical protein
MQAAIVLTECAEYVGKVVLGTGVIGTIGYMLRVGINQVAVARRRSRREKVHRQRREEIYH